MSGLGRREGSGRDHRSRVGCRHDGRRGRCRTRRASCGGQPPPTTSIPAACSASEPARTRTPAPRCSASRRRGAPASAWSATSGLGRPTALVLARRPETVTADGRVQAWLIGSGTDADARVGCRDDRAARQSSRRRCRWSSTRARSTSPSADGARDRHAARTRARAAAGAARPRRGLRRRMTRPRAASAVETAAALGATVVLKGAVTIVASPDGWATAVSAGTPWLATAGTGDVLAGVIGAVVSAAVARDRPRLASRPRESGCTGAPPPWRRATSVPSGGPITARTSPRRCRAPSPRRSTPPERLRVGLRPHPWPAFARPPPRIDRCRGGRCCGSRSRSCTSSCRGARVRSAEPADGRRLPRLRAVVDLGARRRRDRRHHRVVGLPAARAGADGARAGLRVDRRRTRSRGRSSSPSATRSRSRCWSARGRSSGRIAAAWFWLAFIAAARTGRDVPPRRGHGAARGRRMPVARRPSVARLDPARRRDLDQGLAGRAPRGRGDRGRRRLAVVGGALLVSAATLHRGGRRGRRRHRLRLRHRPDRSRDCSSRRRSARFYLWRAVAGIPGSFIYYDRRSADLPGHGPRGRRRDRRHDAAADRRGRWASRRSARTRRGAAPAS